MATGKKTRSTSAAVKAPAGSKQSTTRQTRRAAAGPLHVLSQGGPTLYNLRIRKPEIRFYVNGPGMLFESLRLLTSLGASSGATAGAFQTLATEIEVHVFCGHAGDRQLAPTLTTSRIGARLDLALGPMGMYQSELVLRTKSGETFEKLLLRAFGKKQDDDFVAALEPIAATGHAEHHPHVGEPLGGEVDPPHSGHSHGDAGAHAGHHH